MQKGMPVALPRGYEAGGKHLRRTLWERGQVWGLNLYTLEEGPLSKATLDDVAKADVPMMFLDDWKNLEKCGGSQHKNKI